MKKEFIIILGLCFLLISCGTSFQPNNKKNLTEYYFKKPNLKNVSYEGGDGSSFEKAVIIKNAKNTRNGIASEYSYLEKEYGKRGTGWIFISQSLERKNENIYDVLRIQNNADNEILIIHFEISDFYGKL